MSVGFSLHHCSLSRRSFLFTKLEYEFEFRGLTKPRVFFYLVHIRLGPKYYAPQIRPKRCFEPMTLRSQTIHFTSAVILLHVPCEALISASPRHHNNMGKHHILHLKNLLNLTKNKCHMLVTIQLGFCPLALCPNS